MYANTIIYIQLVRRGAAGFVSAVQNLKVAFSRVLEKLYRKIKNNYVDYTQSSQASQYNIL